LTVFELMMAVCTIVGHPGDGSSTSCAWQSESALYSSRDYCETVAQARKGQPLISGTALERQEILTVKCVERTVIDDVFQRDHEKVNRAR
jgi:hypothetical protein